MPICELAFSLSILIMTGCLTPLNFSFLKLFLDYAFSPPHLDDLAYKSVPEIARRYFLGSENLRPKLLPASANSWIVRYFPAYSFIPLYPPFYGVRKLTLCLLNFPWRRFPYFFIKLRSST